MESYNLINGNIITLNAKYPTVNSISIQHGKIIRINNPKKNIINIDLKGKTVIPGFIDAHFHLKNFGKRLEQLNLKQMNDLNEIGNCIKEKLKNISREEWLLGFGWDQNLFKDGRYPPSDSGKQIKKWIKKAIDQTIKMGITGVHDAWQDYNTVQAI